MKKTQKSSKMSSLKQWIYPIVVMAILWSLPSNADETLRHFVLCRNGKTVRTIRVEVNPTDSTSWVTTYTKNGKDEIVGEGKNPSSCDAVMERVQKTLESNAWKCKDSQNAFMHRETAGT